MKKLVAILMVLSVIMLTSAYAKKVGSPDEECQANGFDFGIAKWEYGDGVYSLSDDGEFPGYTTNVIGNNNQANWTSDPAAAGILTKEAGDTFVHPGGMSGIVNYHGSHAISHLTLCGNFEEIPEFTTIGATLVLAGAGLYIYRKKRQ